MTIMMNTSILPSGSVVGNEINFSKEDLQAFVDSGIIKKIDRHKEHFAVQPCWIHDPGKGVMEEINNSVLGRWNKRLQGYIVHVDNIRNADNSAALNEDHRWLHVDVFATFYVYIPEMGQKLRGEIKKVGTKAAICIVFDVFTATVFANDDAELSTWNIGDEIHFKISSFQDRRKGPILRCNSIKTSRFSNNRKRKRSMSHIEIPPDENGVEAQSQISSFEVDEHEHSASHKKSKKRKKNKEEPNAENESMNNDVAVEDNQSILPDQEETEIYSRRKKKKKKSSRMDK